MANVLPPAAGTATSACGDKIIRARDTSIWKQKYVLLGHTDDADRVRMAFTQSQFGKPSFDFYDDMVALRQVDVTIPLGNTRKSFTITR